jgi:D-xylose transport system substrate-binding protein
VALVNGRRPAAGLVNGKVPNGEKEVPSVLLKPIVVTKGNVKDTVVKDGFLKPGDICRAKAASACRAEGIA